MSSSITYTFLLALIPIAISAIAIALMGDSKVETTKQPSTQPSEA
jgi:uncharacterized BrkB/YihY/UPF0761 family membrane protein